jgi:uncharacterized protein YndB with AHSA1/START domain
MTNSIERSVDISAPVDAVWRALSDHEQFGQWFGVKLEGPFVVGQASRGRITHPGYEHVVWEAKVVAIEPPTRLAFAWHPYAIDPEVDYSAEPMTTVEFTIQPIVGGARVKVVESGFDAIPEHRRAEAFRMNSGGWDAQMENIRAHVES